MLHQSSLGRRVLLGLLPCVFLIGGLLAPTSALAHERRTVGKYDFLVGWDVEPAFQGQKNAASIRITQSGTDPAVPVEGAEKTLKVQIRQGNDTREFPLRSVFGQKGYYVADVVPMRTGNYQWTFVGSINGDPVNERFDTADGKFNGVEPIATLLFPSGAGDLGDAPAAAMLGEVVAAVSVLDNSNLHEVDEALDGGNALPAGSLGMVQRAQLVVGATHWPTPLRDTAGQLTTQLTQLRNALEAGDMNAAMGPAHDAHETEHMLSSQAYGWLAAQANLAAPGGGDDEASAVDGQ